jgi:tetratricopeptide (TPR) repeat protein
MEPQQLEARVVETWDFDDPVGSRAAFEAAVETAGSETPEGMVLRTQVARTHSLQRHFEDADAILDGVQTSFDTQTTAIPEAAAHHVRARIAIERGRTRNSGGSPGAARPMFETAYDEATAAGLTALAVDALHMSAIAVSATDGPDVAAAVTTRAIAEAEASDDPATRRWLGPLLNNHGWDLHDAGDYEGALKVFRRAVEVRTEFGTPRELAIAKWAVGRCLRSLGRYVEALEIQEALADSDDAAEDGYVYEEIGENLLALDRGTEAVPYFSQAHDLLSEDDWLVDNESERLERLLTLSDE